MKHDIPESFSLVKSPPPSQYQGPVLKPSLHGGFSGTESWIGLAQRMGIDWWITSALESNLGLSAIAQFVSAYPNSNFQGLGTGSLFKENFKIPYTVDGGFFKKKEEWAKPDSILKPLLGN